MHTLIKVPIPPEPVGLRHLATRKANSPEWSFASKSSVYNLYVMGGGGLPKYLWSHWREQLKAAGLTWQVFQRAISACKDDVRLWIDGRMSWEELVTKVILPVLEKAIRGEYPLWPP